MRHGMFAQRVFPCLRFRAWMKGLPCEPDARAREYVTIDGRGSREQFAPVPDFLSTHFDFTSKMNAAPELSPLLTVARSGEVLASP